jgi:hypothetical protein
MCKRLRSPGIDSKESISPGWEPILGILQRLTNTGSAPEINTAIHSQTKTGHELAQEYGTRLCPLPFLFIVLLRSKYVMYREGSFDGTTRLTMSSTNTLENSENPYEV